MSTWNIGTWLKTYKSCAFTFVKDSFIGIPALVYSKELLTVEKKSRFTRSWHEEIPFVWKSAPFAIVIKYKKADWEQEKVT